MIVTFVLVNGVVMMNPSGQSEFLAKNPIDFDLIELRKYTPQRLTRNVKRSVMGLDTETLNGYCRLIADSRRNYLMTDDIDEILEFMTGRRFRSTHNFFYNMNFDINAIIKYLPRDNLTELYEGFRTTYGDYSLFFIPRKIFRIHHNKHTFKFYDVFQFFNTSLEKASKRYLGLDKYVDPIDRATLGTSAKYWKDNEDAIIRYCINDARLTKKLGRLLDKTLIDSINLYPNSYVSKASVCKDFVRRRCVIPDIHKIPVNALRYAFNSYSGGRFEIIKKGHVGHCTLFDIVSAYPYHTRNLIDVTKGKWRRVKDINEKADYGFYLADVTTHYGKISPLSVTLRNGIVAYPIIDTRTYVTKEEILAFEDKVDFNIRSGYEFYADEIVYPFRDYIDHVYELKAKTPKDKYEYQLYKIMMNSLYGTFYEKNVREDDDGEVKIIAGKLFNPIYATLITANTRIQLVEMAYRHLDEVVGFATDSILFKGKPEIKTSKELGAWDMEAEGEAVVLRSGIYQIDKTLKNRGIKKAERLTTPYGDFPTLFDYIRSRPLDTEYPITMNRPLTFIEVLLHHLKHDLEDINQFVDLEYVIDINKDSKRLWQGQFQCGLELFDREIDSDPLVLM